MKSRFRLAVALWVLALIGSLAVIARTHFTADMSAFLPKNPTEQQALLNRPAQGRRAVAHAADRHRRRRCRYPRRALAKPAARTAEGRAVRRGEQRSNESHARERELLFRNRYLLSPAGHAPAPSAPKACAMPSATASTCSPRRPA